jgi:hypothetical protein
MENYGLNYATIQTQSPKAWEDFVKFYKTEFEIPAFLKNIEITQIPFEMQLGVFLKYFNENGVELDVCNTEYSLLPEHITEAFQTHEKVISHYS